jgi:hypothetical protein
LRPLARSNWQLARISVTALKWRERKTVTPSAPDPPCSNSTGSRTFYSDQTMVIHEHYGPEPVTLDDPETK